MAQERVLIIAGATATGKSALAMQVARQIRGEIISVDSMQVYRGMDIGTAKPTNEERAQVRHHLIDVVNVDEPFNAARFAALAGDAILDVTTRGRVPILCGGTGLYFQALLYGLSNAPPSDPTLRAEIEQLSLDELSEELKASDPETLAKLDRRNRRRLVRAVEVVRSTGQPYSAQQASWKTQRYPALTFLCTRDRDDLRERIDARVDAMFAGGFVDEVQALLGKGLAENKTAMQALGYRQIVEHLRGQGDLCETVERIKLRTRQFAKRQHTWFRHQIKGEWLNLSAPHDDFSRYICARWTEA